MQLFIAFQATAHSLIASSISRAREGRAAEVRWLPPPCGRLLASPPPLGARSSSSSTCWFYVFICCASDAAPPLQPGGYTNGPRLLAVSRATVSNAHTSMPPPPPRQVLARIAQLAVAASLPLAVALFAARGSLPGLFTDDSLVAAEVVRGFVPPWSCACACR